LTIIILVEEVVITGSVNIRKLKMLFPKILKTVALYRLCNFELIRISELRIKKGIATTSGMNIVSDNLWERRKIKDVKSKWVKMA